MKRFFEICYALLERETAGKIYYRFAFIAEIVSGIIYFAGIFFVGKLIPRELIYNKDYFTLTVIGIGLYTLSSALFTAPRNFLIGEITMGTFETMITLGPSTITYVIASSTIKGIKAVIRCVIILTIAFIFGLDIYYQKIFLLIPIIILSFLAGIGAGFIFASIDLRIRTSGRLIAMASGSSSILTGVYFPVSLLPKPFKLISSLLPTTYAILTARQILLFNSSPFLHIFILSVFAFILLSVGIILLRVTITKMKIDGSFCYY